MRLIRGIDSEIAGYDPADELINKAMDRAQNSQETPFGAGKRFRIPLVIPEGVKAGDGRVFEKGSLDITENLPLPLLWQPQLDSKHDGAVIVGKIDSISRVDDGIGDAYGSFDTGAWGKEAQRLVEGQYIKGISADMDNCEGEDHITKARVVGATLVAKPAFQECVIEIVPDFAPAEDEIRDMYEEELPKDDGKSALIASAAPVTPPEAWFVNPNLFEPTPLTVTDDGRVYGHIATWSTSHIGMPNNTRPPKSASDYKFFKTGVVRTDTGKDIPVGHITLTGGHASPYASAADAVKHYDDTNSAVVDVNVGEDRYGIWVAGALRPDVSELQVRAFRASAPSGDWRTIGGRLELVAICQVNVPGFPVARTVAASGVALSLCAAGTSELVAMKRKSLEDRVADLEHVTAEMLVASIDMSSLAALQEEEDARLSEQVENAIKVIESM